MNKDVLIGKLMAEYSTDFSGWDFSYLTDSGRMRESVLPWNYRSLVEDRLSLARNSVSLLDMGTGGGEFLLSLKNLPPETFATEGYEPNLKVAQENLKEKGIEVRFIGADDRIPYDDRQFTTVINRHESFDSGEVNRVLKAGGVFITQQVGGLNDLNLNSALNAAASEYSSWHLFSAVKDLSGRGFRILRQQEAYGYTRFYDIGAIVYYLKCIPWQIPDFSVERYADSLHSLHEYIETNGYLDLINHRFVIIAEKTE